MSDPAAREPNFTPRTERVGPYEVRFLVSGVARMSTGIRGQTREEPAIWAYIYREGRLITRSSLNAATMCLPGGSVRGPEATASEIVLAVLGDEHIFTGERTFPEENLSSMMEG